MEKIEKEIENIFLNEVSQVDILLTYLSDNVGYMEFLQNFLKNSIEERKL